MRLLVPLGSGVGKSTPNLKVLGGLADLLSVAYKTDNQTSVTRRVQRRPVLATPTPSVVRPRPEIPMGQVSGATTQRTTMILQVVLAAATCLTLIGAIATLSSGGPETIPATSPDAAPPSVLIQVD